MTLLAYICFYYKKTCVTTTHYSHQPATYCATTQYTSLPYATLAVYMKYDTFLHFERLSLKPMINIFR